MMKKPAKRKGIAFWLSDRDGDLVRALATVEDRPIQTILTRALRAYAETSPEYQLRAACGEPPAAVKRTAA